MRVKKHILLTGAGFTKNFGGFLADEMWAHIFNDPLVQGSENFRKQMFGENPRHDFDYERVYEDIIGWNNSETHIFTDVLLNAYKKIDRSIVKWKWLQVKERSKILANLGSFINLFKGENGEKGFFFTLNQDWLIERFGFDRLLNARYFLYPLNIDTPDLRNKADNQFDDSSDFQPIPNNVSISFDSGDSFYVKFHGSFHWKTNDGRNLMLIGNQKSRRINEHQILSDLWGLFQTVMREKTDLKLFIIGYGFRDRHVNEVIAEAIQNRNLKVAIISPNPIREMEKYLQFADTDTCQGNFGRILFEGLSNYFNYSLEEILSGEQLNSEAFLDIKKCFFDN